ncbi:MAG: FAD-dependent oxidoreductase [Halanaerobiales bacterium]|nr:FAD-dependent oxidoreductase [Halanaerobiales bacterium]
MKKKVITIIGGGPGGYVAAIRAAQLGAEVNLVEKEKIGGTCLNWGCIPTKAFVYSAKIYSDTQNAKRFGIDVESASVNMKRVIKNKDGIVKQLVGGVEFLLKKHEVNVIKGIASLLDQNTVSVKTDAGREIIETDYIILATGSKVKKAPIKGIDLKGILTSKDILDLEQLPKSLAIIGGGVIGMEFASIFSAFGVDVKVVEYLDDILPGVDKEITKELRSIAKRERIQITTGAQVTEIKKGDNFSVTYIKDEKEETLDVEKVLVATGREPSFGGLDLEKLVFKKKIMQ